MDSATHDLDVDGTRIRLRERTPDDHDEAVVFVHGATFPGRVAFDLDVDPDVDPGGPSYSWLDATANAGRAAFAVDLRGYGDSDRPPSMDAPAEQNPPPARAADVATDVEAGLAFVRERVDRVHLVGYSWGSIVCGHLLAGPDALGHGVASLTQFAPVFRMDETAAARFDPGDPAPAYRRTTRADVAERWNDQVPDGADPAAWRGGGPDDPVLDAFWTQLAATGQGEDEDPETAAAETPRTVRAPNGTLLDLRESVDADPYDPAAIPVPTLVVRGSEDRTATRTDSLRLYDALDAPREYAEVGGGTHFLPLESRRATLHGVVSGFHDRV